MGAYCHDHLLYPATPGDSNGSPALLTSLKSKTCCNQVKFCRTNGSPAICHLPFAIGHWRWAIPSEAASLVVPARLRQYAPMSNLAEIVAAAGALPPEQKQELMLFLAAR